MIPFTGCSSKVALNHLGPRSGICHIAKERSSLRVSLEDLQLLYHPFEVDVIYFRCTNIGKHPMTMRVESVYW